MTAAVLLQVLSNWVHIPPAGRRLTILESVSDIDSGARCARSLYDCAAISIVPTQTSQMNPQMNKVMTIPIHDALRPVVRLRFRFPKPWALYGSARRTRQYTTSRESRPKMKGEGFSHVAADTIGWRFRGGFAQPRSSGKLFGFVPLSLSQIRRAVLASQLVVG
jgi:hypothetical protein